MAYKVTAELITLKPTIKPEDRKYIQRFDFIKASTDSIKKINERPFYTK